MLGASPNTISALSDLVVNQIPTSVSKWMFEIKLYREKSTPSASQQQQQQDIRFLHTLTFSQHTGDIVCLVNGTGSVLVGQFETILGTKLQSLWQQRQVVKGEGSAYEMSGGTGTGGDLENSTYWIRLGNMNLQGTFKGLVIEIEHSSPSFWPEDGPAPSDDLNMSPVFMQIKHFVDQLNLVQAGRLILGPPKYLQARPFTKVETAWQYVEALQNRI